VEKKKPRFFCESCGHEVKQNAKICLHCGKFFSSVKCPACGFSGDSPAFNEGCPVCGYAVFGQGKKKPQAPVSGKKDAPDPLPWWMYLVSILFLVALVGFILIQR